MKNEIILISPGPTGFVLRDTLASFVSRQPKRRETPLNILSIGTVLKKAGFTIRLIDGRDDNIPHKLKIYLNHKTLFVGISSLTGYQIIFGLKASEIVRRIAPHLPIVWGGLHPSVLPEETLQSKYVDVVCRGEGDITAVELAQAIQERYPLENIKGIAYKENGRIVNNPSRKLIDMDDLYTDYSLLDPSVYDFSYIAYQSSRGCPHRCRFCEVGPVHGRRYRIRSIQKVIDDIEELVKQHETKEINLIDENFFVNLNRAREFADSILRKGLKIRWRAMSRADYFRKTDINFWQLMKKSGCKTILIGAESGSQKVLDDMKKDYKVDDIINAALQLSKASIKSSFGFMCGLPDEDEKDMKMTIKLVEKILPLNRITVNGIFLFTPLPKTDYYQEVRKRGALFPARLKDWGTLLWGSKRYLKWHPFNEYAFRLSIVSKWIERFPLSRIFRPLKHLDIPMFVLYLCGHLSYYRWRYKFFAFPLDIYIQYWINRYIIKHMWWR